MLRRAVALHAHHRPFRSPHLARAEGPSVWCDVYTMTVNETPPDDRDARIVALVGVIRTAEAELSHLTGDQVDAKALGDGAGSIMLPDDQRQLLEREAAHRAVAAELQGMLNAVPAHIALLDADGVIVAVNEAWRKFGEANGLSGATVGVNYLDVCDGATGACSDEARPASDGIRRVLRGEVELFTLEYPCHSPDQRRWFPLMVTPVFTHRGGAVVTHVDVTARWLAEETLRASEARLRETQRIAGLGSWGPRPDLRRPLVGGRGGAALRSRAGRAPRNARRIPRVCPS